MLQNSDSVKTNAWQPAVFNVSTSKDWKLVQYGQAGMPGLTTNGVPNNVIGQNVRSPDYCAGIFFIAMSGVPANTVGEIWIDYVIELSDTIDSRLSLNLPQHVQVTASAATTPFDVPTAITSAGYRDITFPAAHLMYFIPIGPFQIVVTGPTSAATASTDLTFSYGTSYKVGEGVGANGFMVSYVWKSTTTSMSALLSVNMSSFTNMTTSPSFPFKIYILPYDDSTLALTLH